MDFVWDKASGLHLCLIKPVWVCPECGKEAPIFEKRITAEGTYDTYRCPNHPDAKLIQQHHMAPDLVSMDPRKDYGWGVSQQHGDPKARFWEQNYEANRGLIDGQSVWDLPQSNIVYLVGSGPSLKEQLPLFDKIGEGVVITLNDAQRYVKGDYFFTVDFIFENLGPEHARDTVALLPPYATPKLTRLPWKDIRWIRSGAHNPIMERISNAHPNVWHYWEGLNGTYACMQFIVQILKPQIVVLVGMDAAFSGGQDHIGKDLKWDETHRVVQGPDNSSWLTSEILLSQRDYMMAQLMYLTLGGIKVWNASGGIVPEVMHVRVAPRVELGEAIGKLNGEKQEDKDG